MGLFFHKVNLYFLIFIIGIIYIFSSQKIFAAEPIKILPIVVEVEDVAKLKQMFGLGNNSVNMGFSIGFEYLAEQFTYTNNDHTVNPSYVDSFINAAKATQMPMLVHLNGHRWTVADYISNTPSTMMYTYDNKPITSLPEWNDTSQGLINGVLPATRISSFLFSLNEYNSIYRNYKKRNIQSIAKHLVEFSNANPNLFAGVSLDSEVSLCPAGFKFNKYSFDYNEQTIVQWRYWLSGITNSYQQSQFTNPYNLNAKYANKGKNLTLEQLKTRYNQNYASWDYVSPPQLVLTDAGQIISIPANENLKNDWLEFRVTLINNMLSDMVNWVEDAGIPRNKIYTHQQPTNSFPNFNLFCGVPYTSANVSNAGYGSMLYGDMTADINLVNELSSLTPNWGLFEWNPANTANPENQSTNYTLKSLQLAYDKGADIICPNYFISSQPLFPQDTLQLYGNTGFIEGLKTFISNNANVVVDNLLPGDANRDKKIDLLDFGIWKKEYLKISNLKLADFNQDNTINLIDFGIWKKAYIGSKFD